MTITVDLRSIDETGYVWRLLDEARDPAVIFPGAIVAAGGYETSAVAQVVDVVSRPTGDIVHLELLPGRIEDYVALVGRVRTR